MENVFIYIRLWSLNNPFLYFSFDRIPIVYISFSIQLISKFWYWRLAKFFRNKNKKVPTFLFMKFNYRFKF